MMIKKLLKKYERLIKYGLITIFITILDIAVGRIALKIGLNIVISNTLGVVTGSIFQYILTLKFAFKNAYSKENFLIHVSTFLFGLLIANIVIKYAYNAFLLRFSEKLSFYIAKTLSIVSTFFITYVLRLNLYKKFE
ncbi:GtrA family protein [Peptoniphilus faecalis]|uniref:GtrA family protein n=1 Tax=Peptoniphilus faecalis TaxID=2731255 RepID=UPI0038B32AE8